MNFQQRFLEIQDLLKPYQNLWQNEIMLMYPDPVGDYSLEWIEDLLRFQDKTDVIKLEKKEVFDFIESPSLIEFYRQIEKLEKLPTIPDYPPMPEDRFTWLYIIPKKQHEIMRLTPHLNALYQERQIKNVIDVGGGVGLLAQTLTNQFQMQVTSIDMNAELQKTGIERNRKNAKDPANTVQFKNIRVENGGEFIKLLQDDTMPVGLHTCGKLALDLIRVSTDKKVPALVNFGCCYHTLEKSPDMQQLSKFAQKNDALWMNKFALTLSCRAHRKMDEKDYDFKIKVKHYRYAFHILLHDFYHIEELVNLGNSSPKLYDAPFAEYAMEQFKRIGIDPKQSMEELNSFYANQALKKLIEQMLAAGLIRNAMGRLLEIYLLLDRAIYLEENGYQVQVQEFFEEEISPRNIGITALLQ
jgi:hypothetical protein